MLMMLAYLACNAEGHLHADRPGRLMLMMLVHLAFNAEGLGS